MTMYDYLIVGSGLYGSICAYELKKKGYKVLVLEKRNHIGGNIYTERVKLKLKLKKKEKIHIKKIQLI